MLIHVLKGNSIRSTEDRFQHSPSTVSKVIKEISSALIKCSTLLIDQFRETGCPSYIRNNPRFYPYFKDCVGAFDGSHISAMYIERGFGVIKKRFPILCMMMSYSFEDQIDLVCCCFILHNLIRIYQSIPDRCDEVDDDENGNDEEEEEDEQNNKEADANVNTFRDTIAQVMWNDYLAEAARRNV